MCIRDRALDGKLMRGPSQCDGEHTTGKEGFQLWMVSAWSAVNGISLGQVKVCLLYTSRLRVSVCGTGTLKIKFSGFSWEYAYTHYWIAVSYTHLFGKRDPHFSVSWRYFPPIQKQGLIYHSLFWQEDRKSTRLNSSHSGESRMPSSA